MADFRTMAESSVAVLLPAPEDAEAVAEATDKLVGVDSVPAKPEPAAALHVTVAYAEAPTDDEAAALAETVNDVAGAWGPIDATIVSVEPLGGDGAVVAMLDGPEINRLHEELQARLEAVAPGTFAWSFPTFIAHMTVAYGPPPPPDGDDEDAAALAQAADTLQPLVGTNIQLDSLGVMSGDDTTLSTPLGGASPQEEAMEATTVGGTAALATDPDLEALVGTPVSFMDPETGQDETGVVQAVDDDGICEVVRDSDGQVVIVPVIDLVPGDETPVPTEGDTVAADRLAVQREAAQKRMAEARGNGEFAGGTAQVNSEAPTEVADDGTWEGVLVIEGLPSGDGRLIAEGALTHRELPLPLMVMFKNPDSGAPGHAGAELAGRIDWIERRDDGSVWGGGKLDLDSPAGAETYRLMKEGFMRGVSVDLDEVVAEFENEMPDDLDLEGLMGFDPGNMIVTSARVMGATMTVFPAFQEAQLVLLSAEGGVGFTDEPCPCGMGHAGEDHDSETLVASAGSGLDGVEVRMWTPWVEGTLVASAGAGDAVPVPHEPPLAWFEKQDLAGPTKLRVGRDGQVFGHVAEWGTCHIAFSNRCVPVPRSSSDYSEFKGGSVLTAEGRTVATGPIIIDTVHPNLKMRAADAMSFYAHTGCAVADVTVYEDQWGIQVAGALRPGVTWAEVRALRGSDISPDWRPLAGRGRECVAMLAVNNSGFKLREAGDQMDLPALVASAGVDAGKVVEAGLDGAIMPGRVAASIAVGSGDVGAMVGGRRPNPARGNQGLQVLMGQVLALRAEVRALSARQDATADVVRPMRAAKAKQQLAAIAGGATS